MIWFDLDNSPHVHICQPLIKELERRGYTVWITAREYAQTLELLDFYGLTYEVIGKHAGKNAIKKIVGLGKRALELRAWAKKTRPALAVSHGSRAMVCASKTLRIPIVTLYDYEYTERKIFDLLSTRVLVPKCVAEVLGKPSFHGKLFGYPGFKEELYLASFVPDEDFRRKLGVREEEILVTLRPAATLANYHDARSEQLLRAFLKRIAGVPQATVVLLSRTKSQGEDLQRQFTALQPQARLLIPASAIDGLNLIWHSDLVISGGGTMNREAALLGVPVYSIFTGTLGAVDAELIRMGRLRTLRTVDEVARVKVERSTKEKARFAANSRLASLLVDEILKVKKA